MRGDSGGLGQEQGGRFMASWHFFFFACPTWTNMKSVRLPDVCPFLIRKQLQESIQFLAFPLLKSDFFLQRVALLYNDQIQIRLFHFSQSPTWKACFGKREERNGLHVKVVVFTLTLTKLILLGRVWVRHDRHVHRLKLSKYECSETGPIRIAGAPHVP